MKIAIFGLGYVGCVTGAVLASLGYKVIGVDVNPEKVELVNKGKSPIFEKGLAPLLSKVVSEGLFSAVLDSKTAVLDSEISLVCVGTPQNEEGDINLEFTKKVSKEIGNALREKEGYHVVAFKSTMFPGTVESIIIPIIEKASGKKAGFDFGICHNPEFLREGNGIDDFINPPHTVIGQFDEKSGNTLKEIYKEIDAPIIITKIKVAEMIKYVNNSFHALKVGFANEIGRICKENRIDSHEVMNVFFDDKKLNISKKYLLPGAPFGGSCLTKDTFTLVHRAKKYGMDVPVLESIKKSNKAHIDYCIEVIKKHKKKNIGFLGISFKEGTDDVRESAIMRIIKRLLEEGYKVKIYDKNVSETKKFGVNKKVLEEAGIISLFVGSVKEIADSCNVIIISTKEDEFKEILNVDGNKCIVIDFARLFNTDEIKGKNYEGICW